MKTSTVFITGLLGVSCFMGALALTAKAFLDHQENAVLKNHVIPSISQAQIKLGYSLASAGISNTNIVDICNAYTTYMMTNSPISSSFEPAHWSLIKTTNNELQLYFNK